MSVIRLLNAVGWSYMPIGAYGASTIDLRLVPGIAIASRGPVSTVMLLGEVPREEMTSVVLDEASRTSQLLVQILLRERGLAPTFERAEHDRVVDCIGGQPALAAVSHHADHFRIPIHLSLPQNHVPANGILIRK